MHLKKLTNTARTCLRNGNLQVTIVIGCPGIMLTCPCNLQPLTPYFCIEKNGVYKGILCFLFLLFNINTSQSALQHHVFIAIIHSKENLFLNYHYERFVVMRSKKMFYGSDDKSQRKCLYNVIISGEIKKCGALKMWIGVKRFDDVVLYISVTLYA